VKFAVRRRAELVVDITPLIDIIFQLVLFFMVSTTFVTTPGIEVELPRSSSDVILREKAEVRVWVTAEGSVLVDEQPVDWAGLEGAFRRAMQEDTATLVVIKADKSVGHGRVVAVMDLARSMGLSNLAIATEANAAQGGGGEGGGAEAAPAD
jgi:biopolymer transport protein ExbD